MLDELHKAQAVYEDLHLRHEAQIRDNAQLSRLVVYLVSSILDD